MDSNFEQFSIYSGKVLEVLSSRFPVPVHLNEGEVIKEYLRFDRDEDIKESRLNKDIAELVLALEVHDEKEIAFAKKRRDELKDEIDELEEEKRRDYCKQLDVLNGSVEFLVAEGLIRRMDCGGLQLTSQAFFHLNKKFDNGAVADSKTPLSRLREVFSSGAEVSRSIAVGVSINAITAVLTGS